MQLPNHFQANASVLRSGRAVGSAHREPRALVHRLGEKCGRRHSTGEHLSAAVALTLQLGTTVTARLKAGNCISHCDQVTCNWMFELSPQKCKRPQMLGYWCKWKTSCHRQSQIFVLIKTNTPTKNPTSITQKNIEIQKSLKKLT